MRKIYFTFPFLLSFLLIIALTGCNTSAQAVNLDQIKLAPVNVTQNYEYIQEKASIGDVVITKGFTGSFMNLSDKDQELYLIDFSRGNNDDMKAGETGSIYINKDPNGQSSSAYKETAPDCSGEVVGMTTFNYGNNSAQVFAVKITSNSENYNITKNGRADFKIITSERINCVRIPKTAIKNYGGKTMVGIIKNGVKYDREVTVGLQGDYYAEIKSGLKAGELVAIGTK